MNVRLIGKNKTGFTLVETIISLLITSMGIGLVMICLNSFRFIRGLKRQNDFYRYLDVIESDQFRFRLKGVENNRVFLKSRTDKKDYVLEPYSDLIRLRGAVHGHMPLIFDVKDVHFKKHGPILKTSINLNGDKYGATSRLE